MFTDAIGGPPQRLEVREIQGELVAFFPADDNDAAPVVLVADMQGDWAPAS
jgi:hypothetical protein